MARLRVLYPAVAAVVITGIPGLARAATIIPTPYDQHKTLHVEPGDTWQPAKGEIVEIITETLTIDGTIDADSVGHQGVPGADGTGAGAGLAGQMGSAPGGGAGFFGKGGPGISFVDAGVCQADPNGGAGGPAFINGMGNLGKVVGSAGGGSDTDRGGAGGGHIIIRATTVILNGTGLITANGQVPGHLSGYAGGGSGGIIEIHAVDLKGNGKIEALGAAGAHSSSTSGGGGSGGIVLLDLVNPWSGTPDVAGGATAGCAEGDGQPGKVIKSKPANDCVDADQDGFYPKSCSPPGMKPDCDDSDSARFPGNDETCDGKDNDCNGVVDDNLIKNACKPNTTCRNGHCQTDHEIDAGMKDAGGGGPSPDRVDFGGGCDVTSGATVSGFAASIAALAGLGLLLRARVRRVRDRKRR